MGGKKRPERSIRSARKDGICVSTVGDQRIGSSRSAGVSLGHEESPILLGLRSPIPRSPSRSSTGSSREAFLSLSLSFSCTLCPSAATRPKHASRRSILLARDKRMLVPFYQTGSYGYSMRGRTTDIDRLITRLRGGPHGPRR